MLSHWRHPIPANGADWKRGADAWISERSQPTGGIGLIVPQLTGMLPILTSIAAMCLVVLMLGAVKTHVDLGESVSAPAALALLGTFVALGRFGIL